MSSVNPNNLLSKAIHYLKFRDRSEAEMRTYLARKSSLSESHDSINQIITQLYELKFLNDFRFAQSWASSYLKRGFGPLKVKIQLKQKQISETDITTVLEAIPPSSWRDEALSLISRKNSLFNKLNQKERISKIKKYLYSRGYTWPIINAVIDEVDPNELK